MFKKYLNRTKEDSGLSVTLYSMLIVSITLVAGMFIVGFSRLIYQQNLLAQYAQSAVHVAIKEQSSLGGLKAESATRFIREYMNYKTEDSIVGTASPPRKQTDWTDPRTRGGADNIGNCANISNPEEYPKIKLTYTSDRSLGSGINSLVSSTFTGGNITQVEDWIRLNESTIFNNQYKGLTVEIQDLVKNDLGLLTSTDQCRVTTINASSISTSRVDEHLIQR